MINENTETSRKTAQSKKEEKMNGFNDQEDRMTRVLKVSKQTTL